ncbi:MAG: hypothetical protein HOU01_09670, partial [Streptomycetaceae bacterium]|nr:hypothetical protein [Streptomycetaceae bacterium]
SASAQPGNSAYTDCLRANGVTQPAERPGGRGSDRPSGRPTARPTDRPTDRATDRPSGRPSGFPESRSTDPAWQKAMQACASVRPQRTGEGGFGNGNGNGNGNGGGAGNGGGNGERVYASCLKDHQVTIPQGGIAALDRSAAGVADALKACAALAPTPAATGTP